MSDWRLARSLITLRKQIDAAAPLRSKDYDGSIGDDQHSKHHSDHNPDSRNVVCAIDVTHDPAHGFDSYAFADVLKNHHDPRLQYVISNSRIWNSGIAPEVWRRYVGPSAHDHHVHISVKQDPHIYDLDSPWDLSGWLADTAKDSTLFKPLVPGGFVSTDPYDRKVPTAIRTNNPGAINITDWIRKLPGYIGYDDPVGKGNFTVIFRSGEEGVAAWWHLMHNYAMAGADTVGKIINKYGGGQDYSDYAHFVESRTGFTPEHRITLEGDDQSLLRFAKAMFHYEAGKDTPLTDEQILHGFRLARGKDANRTA